MKTGIDRILKNTISVFLCSCTKGKGGRVIPFFLGGLVKINGLSKMFIEIPSK